MDFTGQPSQKYRCRRKFGREAKLLAKNRLGLPPRGAKSVVVVGKFVGDYRRKFLNYRFERVTGVEPVLPVWKTGIIAVI